MKRPKIFLVALITALAFTSGVFAKETFAMGANGGSLAPEEKKGVEEPGRQGDKKTNGKREEGPTQGDDKGKTEKPSQNKKPRLKYRDPYDCSC